MATSKPTLTPATIWARSAATGDVTAPSQGLIDSGYKFADKPHHNHFNSKLKNTDTMLVHIQENGLPTWDANTAYQVGALTLSGGLLYQSKTANTNKTPATSASDWDEIFLTAGSTGGGVWASTTTYVIGDVATYGGIAYIALTASTNKRPDTTIGTDWNMSTNTDSYATSTQGGTVKARYDSGTLYLTIDGTDA